MKHTILQNVHFSLNSNSDKKPYKNKQTIKTARQNICITKIVLQSSGLKTFNSQITIEAPNA